MGKRDVDQVADAAAVKGEEGQFIVVLLRVAKRAGVGRRAAPFKTTTCSV